VHVHEDVIDIVAQLAQRGLDLRKRRTARAQIEVAAEVDHTQAQPVALHHARTVAWLDAQEVGRTQDPRLGIQVGIDLTAVIGVVAERDRVHPAGEQCAGRLRRDPQPACHVLAVDDHERRLEALAQNRQALEQRASPNAADEIADEQDARLCLSHTSPMIAGRA